MKKLLLEILPDLESRVIGLKIIWPGEFITEAIKRNESFTQEIKNLLQRRNK